MMAGRMADPRHISDDENQPLKCPKCGKSMAAVNIGAVTIDRCEGCAGLWLDALEREKLMESKSDVRAADVGRESMGDWTDETEGAVLCPRDHSRMIRMVDRQQPHVRFESCTVCGGTFMDAGELRDLSERTLRERVRRIFAPR